MRISDAAPSLNGKNGHAILPLRKKRGRPSLLNNRIATIICGRMAQGKSLRSICQKKHLPNASTVRDWVIKNPEFAKRYESARKLQADNWAEEILEIADDGRNDTQTVDGQTVVNNDIVQRSRLRVDARKWIVGKLHPRVYGEKPGDVHVSNTTNNFVVLDPERLEKLQQLRQAALSR